MGGLVYALITKTGCLDISQDLRDRDSCWSQRLGVGKDVGNTNSTNHAPPTPPSPPTIIVAAIHTPSTLNSTNPQWLVPRSVTYIPLINPSCSYYLLHSKQHASPPEVRLPSCLAHLPHFLSYLLHCRQGPA